jgi:hypothetical protein
MSGWICLHRDIIKHWIWDDSFKLKAWLDLILLANIEDKKFLIKGQLVECKRGQIGLSQISLSKRWKCSREKVKNFLNLLEKDKMIVQQSTHLNTLITICNYSKFQDIKTTDHTAEPSTDHTADTQQTHSRSHTTKQLNNENNEEQVKKKERFIKPSIQEITDYIKEMNYQVSAISFHAYYESKGWKVGNVKMVSWKSALVTWQNRNNENKQVQIVSPSHRRVIG